MHSVYCYSANINQGNKNDEETSNEHRLAPPIILIGTHRKSFTNGTKNVLVKKYSKSFFF